MVREAVILPGTLPDVATPSPNYHTGNDQPDTDYILRVAHVHLLYPSQGCPVISVSGRAIVGLEDAHCAGCFSYIPPTAVLC